MLANERYSELNMHQWTLFHYDVIGEKRNKEKIHENMHVFCAFISFQMCYMKAQHRHVFTYSPFSAYFFSPLHHSGKGSGSEKYELHEKNSYTHEQERFPLTSLCAPDNYKTCSHGHAAAE